VNSVKKTNLSSGHPNPDDAKAICLRVVNENYSFLMDSLSVGEDHNLLCTKTDPPLCPPGTRHDEFMRRAYEAKAAEKPKEDALEEEL
jgi:hypothetical protein